MNNEELPLYEVEEVSLEEAILMLASEDEKYRADYRESSERLLQFVA